MATYWQPSNIRPTYISICVHYVCRYSFVCIVSAGIQDRTGTDLPLYLATTGPELGNIRQNSESSLLSACSI